MRAPALAEHAASPSVEEADEARISSSPDTRRR
jgi:hypothetical protein